MIELEAADRKLILNCLHAMLDLYSGKHVGYECRPAFLPQLRRIIKTLERQKDERL